MPGGPVNGVPWTGVLSLVGGAGIASAARRGTDPNDPANCTGIIVPTVLQMADDALKYWTSLTCLYDRYWNADSSRVTLPVCMFHVKKITPTFTNETSKKRVMLYEQKESADAKALADNMRPTVMRSVIDNVVQQPRTYTMDIIVPFQPLGRYVTEGVKTISDMVAGLSDLLGGSAPGGFTDWWEGVFSSVFALLKTANTVVDTVGKLPGMDGSAYINMNSLEAMADSCRTLCMKMWTGYDYKYVLITNYSIQERAVMVMTVFPYNGLTSTL
jgi:hypothetical protein